ncbi:NAD(P)/FAD-dependent oxidoreductase [Tepidimonas taiwanensis]|uniref:L-2-hydroxyglutarate oxidase LhgO n=1 Tax=Tepidimonas taiwanensis TaxID=307486 RepID=A0A554X9R8_9BURK|nr:NAD(P)/FAD-dependent oxidoreductase [Tepidimonas taiwanensis]TSE32590.1 L-2-hydroxyglutarate oxidase LhgO [Tepidimonas taiwanensis]UBQ06424.1 NAD(P)/FAD-dependent oxidoreductase [Tepidimonas taiwanensis]
MERVGALVIGAGVIGLAVARALALAGREVVVLERETAIGTGVSARNSEVIHAGLYYTPGSCKARWCVRGKALLYDYAAARGVAHRCCGKLIVATDAEQIEALQRLADRAAANGVPVEWLSAADVRQRAPALRVQAALWSPTTGIVDSHGLMQALRADMEAAGGSVALASVFDAAEPIGARGEGGWRVRGHTHRGEPFALAADVLINAAGLWACHVARAIAGPDPTRWPAPRYAKGSYFALSGRAPADCLVYPAPQDAWLGVHLTLDLAGQARFGPDLEWLAVDTPEAIDYAVDPGRADTFYAAIRRYWPGLPDGALQPAYSGVRPKIHGPDEPAPDFRLDGPAEHGWAGLVHLLGFESPGLTSALAVAEAVAQALGP